MDSFTEGLDLRHENWTRGLITVEKTYQKKTYSLAKGYHEESKTLWR
jgi:hypothetical protein